MRTRSYRPLCMLLALAALAGTLPAANAFLGRPVYTIGNCTKPALRPRTIVFACADGNLYATSIHYQRYGGREAVAQATIHRNTCEPDCAAGHLVSSTGKVTLFSIRRCAGRLYYTEARLSSTPGITWQVGYPRRCGRALG